MLNFLLLVVYLSGQILVEFLKILVKCLNQKVSFLYLKVPEMPL